MFGRLREGEHFRFSLKPREPLGVGGDRVTQNLDGDRPLEVGVLGPIDLAHTARAELAGDFIGTETGAGGQSNGKRLQL